jgi:hypothetical protein
MNLDGTLEAHEIDALVAYHASPACNVSQWRVLWSMIPSDVRDLVLRDAMRILKKQGPMVWQHIADFDRQMNQPAIARTTDHAEGVLLEHECMCHARFALLEDLQEHQETCQTALAIDPADAAEEEEMYAAEELCDYDLQADPVPDFDPFAGEREDENWQ